MNFQWSLFVDLGLISITLMLATLIRAKIPFFQKFLIPNSITAGFMLLLFYNFGAPHLSMDTHILENLIYHLLAISFIAMSLRNPTGGRSTGKRIYSVAIMIITSLTFQAIIGLGLTALLIVTFFPKLFPSFGLFVPLGYELGPGQAFSIGKGWESLGIKGAGNIGLTFAAMGYLWACFGGVYLINYGIKKGWLEKRHLKKLKSIDTRSGVIARGERKLEGARLVTETEAIDSMSFHVGMVLFVYLLTFLFLKFLTYILSFAGPSGKELAVNLWGLSFIFAAIIAILFKKTLTGFGLGHLFDSGTLTRIVGVSVDIMVAAAIGAISLVIVVRYWIPILTIGLVAGVVTTVYVLWLTSRIFDDHHFQRAIIIYGGSTGTMPTGLALLRVIDPQFETPAATDYMYGSGLSFIFLIPFILAINLPVYGYIRGNPIYYWMTAGIILVYLIFVAVSIKVVTKKGSFGNLMNIWSASYDEEEEKSA